MQKQQIDIQQPELYLNERFCFQNITEENFQEACEVFAQGHLASNPIFKSLKYTQKELSEYISLNIPSPYEQINFLPSLVLVDKHNNDKIFGVLQQIDLAEKTNYPKNISKGMQFKQYMDYRLLSPLKQELKEPGMSSIVSYSSLPQYQKYRVGSQGYDVMNYLSYLAGFKYSTNLVYNENTRKFTSKYKDSVLINEVKIQDEYLNGEQVFKDVEYLCAFSFYRQLEEATFSDSTKYSQEFKEKCTTFYNDSRYYFQQRKMLEYQKNSQQIIQQQQQPKL